MASLGYIKSLLNTLPSEVRKALEPAFQHILVDGYSLGGARKATNFSWFAFESTTAATANEEFSILHGLNQIPSQIIPVLDLATVGSQIVPLQVSKAPDAHRIYLKSTSTGAPFKVYIEFALLIAICL